ncbi:unnamed protein product [Rhizophagus irregularis]|nr:unnamed protein product [Rhizophagus irregularis]
MQDDNVEEQVIMNITGHRSVDAVRKYKVPNDQQKMDTLRKIISIQDHKETLIQNITDQEINKSVKDYNMQPLQNSQIMNLESQDLSIIFPDNNKERTPMFSKCHFQNVNFYLK